MSEQIVRVVCAFCNNEKFITLSEYNKRTFRGTFKNVNFYHGECFKKWRYGRREYPALYDLE